MKQCFRCGVSKQRAEFNQSSKNLDGMQSYCRECQKAHYRANYDRHRANVRRTSKLRLARMREIIFAEMSSGCVDCGNRDIRVLEFDHVTGEKIASVGHMVRYGSSVNALKEEIAKCEVRCRNCHAIVTLSRLPSSWHAVFQQGR